MNDTNRYIRENVNKIDKRNLKSVLETRKRIPGYNVIDNTSTTNSTSILNSKSRYTPKYGWIPDTPDYRDYLYSNLRKKIEEEKLTASVMTLDAVSTSTIPIIDLRSTDSPIFDQGELGSCTSNALVGMLQFLEKNDKNDKKDKENKNNKENKNDIVPYTELSRLFIYYDQRVAENTISLDIGAQLRDGIKTLAKLGVCTEVCWSYDISKFAIQPDHKCYIDAANHRILSYYRLNTMADMLHCLNNGYPFVFGFSIYSNFESDTVAKTGIVNMPRSNESLIGGLTVMAIGYDANKKLFPESVGSVLCRNSLGINWGEKGYFWIPLEYLMDRSLSDDFWTIRKGINL